LGPLPIPLESPRQTLVELLLPNGTTTEVLAGLRQPASEIVLKALPAVRRLLDEPIESSGVLLSRAGRTLDPTLAAGDDEYVRACTAHGITPQLVVSLVCASALRPPPPPPPPAPPADERVSRRVVVQGSAIAMAPQRPSPTVAASAAIKGSVFSSSVDLLDLPTLPCAPPSAVLVDGGCAHSPAATSELAAFRAAQAGFRAALSSGTGLPPAPVRALV
jgi:hypothetical protein